MNFRLVLPLGLAILLLAPVVGANSGTYVSNAGLANCANPNTAVGTVCFKIPRGATQVSVSVVDAVFGAMPGTYSFSGLNSVLFCAQGATVAIPPGATTITLAPAASAPSIPVATTVCNQAAVGTTGTAYANFS